MPNKTKTETCQTNSRLFTVNSPSKLIRKGTFHAVCPLCFLTALR